MTHQKKRKFQFPVLKDLRDLRPEDLRIERAWDEVNEKEEALRERWRGTSGAYEYDNDQS